jgi:acyl-CoA synthetase (NDP forming)
LETLRDVDRFREVASHVTARKPVIVQKLGKTAGGARAARSHTGALSGDHALYQALFKQVNLVPSPTLERLFPVAHAFTALPPMTGNRVAMITMGGSWGVALTDKLEERGLVVPELSSALQKRLRHMGMPIRASTRNPIDIGAAVSVALTVDTVSGMGREVLASGEVDALILHGFGRLGFMKEPESPMAMMVEIEKSVMRECARLSEGTHKPVLVASAIHPGQSPAVHDLIEEGMLIFHQLDEIADVLSLMYDHHRRSRLR